MAKRKMINEFEVLVRTKEHIDIILAEAKKCELLYCISLFRTQLNVSVVERATDFLLYLEREDIITESQMVFISECDDIRFVLNI